MPYTQKPGVATTGSAPNRVRLSRNSTASLTCGSLSVNGPFACLRGSEEVRHGNLSAEHEGWAFLDQGKAIPSQGWYGGNQPPAAAGKAQNLLPTAAEVVPCNGPYTGSFMSHASSGFTR